MAFKPIAQLDFSGGANLVVNPYLISQKQSADVQNMILEEHGSVRTREGMALLTTSPDTLSPLLYRGNLIRVDGTEFPFAIQATIGTPGTVTFDATTGANKTGSSGTMSHTCGASATLLLVAVYMDNSPQTVNSVTYDGVAMSRIESEFRTSVGMELWGLADPTTGSAEDVIVTLAGSPAGWRIQAISLIDGASWGTAETNNGSGGTTDTNTVVSDTGHLVVDFFAKDNNNSNLTPTGTSIHETNYSDNNRAEAQYTAGAASVDMTYSGSSLGGPWVHVAVDILPTGAGYQLYRTDTDPWTSVGSVNEEITPEAVYMSDRVVIIHGYAVPKWWDGTSLTAITADAGQTVPPGAKHGEFHLGALWVWNTSATTTSLDGPSSLRASAVNDMDDWPNANQIFISKDDGQVGMGLSPFTIVETGISPTATLVAFKNYSAYQITGVFGASTFSIQPIKSDMGCVAPRTIQFVSGFGIIRLTHKGFALYNGVEDRLVSEEIRPAVFGGHIYEGLDFTNIERSWATQSQSPPLYIAACPVSGTALTRLFVYDLIRRGWTICTLPLDISTMVLYFSRSQFPVIHAGTLTGGQIHALFDDTDDDNGDAISWSMRTRSFFAGNQMTPTYWRRAQIGLNIEPNSIVTVTPIVDGGERDPQTFETPGDPTGTAHTVDVVISPDIMETAHYVQLLIEGACHAHIRGLEFHVAPKMSTKYVNRA